MPVASYFLGVNEINNKLYAIGGSNHDSLLDLVQELEAVLIKYYYDSLNRLNTVVTPDKTLNYQYDENGNLILRSIVQ